MSCVKGKESQTVGELYDLFESLAAELWPDDEQAAGHDDSPDEDLSLEDQISKEVAAMKRPRDERLFTNCQTNTPCVVFISCKAPVDPVKLVVTHVQNVKNTGVTRTKYTHRFFPVSASCGTNLPDIQALCRRVFAPFFNAQDQSKAYRYKVEARIRNHTSLGKLDVIQAVAKCVPETYVVDLDNAEVFFLVEIFKSVCGVSVITDYYELQKFNVMEIANEKNGEGKFREGEGRVHGWAF